MAKNLLFAALAVSALLVLMAAPAFADGNPHVAEAITHAEEAAKHGGMGHAEEQSRKSRQPQRGFLQMKVHGFFPRSQ